MDSVDVTKHDKMPVAMVIDCGGEHTGIIVDLLSILGWSVIEAQSATDITHYEVSLIFAGGLTDKLLVAAASGRTVVIVSSREEHMRLGGLSPGVRRLYTPIDVSAAEQIIVAALR